MAPAVGPTVTPVAAAFIGTEPRDEMVLDAGKTGSVTVAWISSLQPPAHVWVSVDGGPPTLLSDRTVGNATHPVTAPHTYRFTLTGEYGKEHKLAEAVVRVHQR